MPRERSTVLVRLMAAGPGLAQAIADLAALPADAHERTVAEGILVQLQRAIERKPSRTLEEEEFIVRMQSTWEKAREEGRDEGVTEGRKEGRAEEAARAVLTVLRARGISLPEEVRERILAQKDMELLERWLEKAAVATSAVEVVGAPS